MKDQRKSEFRVGMTVLLGALLLLIGFFLLKDWTLSDETEALKMRFENSAGLQSGDPVTINGVKAGKVREVIVDGAGVLVTADIDERYKLAEDASPVIQMLELMGGKKIEIRQGIGPKLHDPSRELRGIVDPDIAGALGMLGSLRGRVDTLADKTAALLDNANSLLGDKELADAARETLEHLRVVARTMRDLTDANKANINEISATLTRLSLRGDEMLAELSPRLNRGIDQAERIAGRADTLLADVHIIVKELRDSQGAFRKLVSDTTLARRLDGVISKLDSVASIIIDGQLRIKLRL